MSINEDLQEKIAKEQRIIALLKRMEDETAQKLKKSGMQMLRLEQQRILYTNTIEIYLQEEMQEVQDQLSQ